MTSTPSSDTVEPTEADRNLACTLCLYFTDRGGNISQNWKAAELIRQYVAAEVARETAELKSTLGAAVMQIDVWRHHNGDMVGALRDLSDRCHAVLSSPSP